MALGARFHFRFCVDSTPHKRQRQLNVFVCPNRNALTDVHIIEIAFGIGSEAVFAHHQVLLSEAQSLSGGALLEEPGRVRFDTPQDRARKAFTVYPAADAGQRD